MLANALEGWSDRATQNGFGEWEGYSGPTFWDGADNSPPVATWSFDVTTGGGIDHRSAIETMLAWLESFMKESEVSIGYLVMGSWEPEEPMPTLDWRAWGW
jgi:hypothetical protein